jgi:heme-degrading monooxygenase HmoA
MYARNARIKLRVGSAPEFRQLVEEKMIPLLRTQKGFHCEITLVSAKRNEAIAVSFWDNQEDADAFNHIAYLDVLRMLSKLIEGAPKVESFEIVDWSLHEVASSAAILGESRFE